MMASVTDTKALCRLAGAAPLSPFTMRADFPEAIIAGALAVKVATHAIEQRCHFRVLAQVDRAPEEEPMGRLVDAIS